MSVSALISQFSKTSSVSDSPPHSPEVSTRSRRHYSTSSVGSSRSESPASCDTHRPDGAPTRHMSVGASSSSNSTKRGLTSITEDKIRMFNSRCKSNNEECTDGPPQRGKRAGAKRQMSAGCTKSGRETEVVKVVPRRQLSAPGMETRGRSPSPFRLPGMASTGGRGRGGEGEREGEREGEGGGREGEGEGEREGGRGGGGREQEYVVQ